MTASLKLMTLAAFATLALSTTNPVFAQPGAADRMPAYPAFEKWISVHVTEVPEAPAQSVQPVSLGAIGGPTPETYQPLPVIVGLPELPLLGGGGAQGMQTWSGTLNYQGVYMRQVVLDARGGRRELRPAAAPLRPGQRFKIRVTSTFDAVAQIDQVTGDVWYGRRTGQIYPQPGLSVQMKAGETVELPLGTNEYFITNRPANERLVVAVRHANAVGEARSNQPVYRQDDRGGSAYLQLVPPGTYPAVEQLISQAR